MVLPAGCGVGVEHGDPGPRMCGRGGCRHTERLLFVNAWNEWAEGAHLEPDQMFEHDWLRAISDALDTRCFRAAD